MAQTVIGMFDNASEAHQAVQQLVNSGFSRDNIDISSSSDSGSSGSSFDSASTGSDASMGGSGSYGTGSMGSGAMGVGSTGTDALGTGGTASTSGSSSWGSGSSSDADYNSGNRESGGSGIGRFFRSLFGNDDEADTYSNVAQKTGAIVTVHAQSSEESERAADILDEAGAVDVDERAAQYGYNANKGTGRTNTSYDTTSNEGTSIPVIEENLEVGKKSVQTGGKRLRSRIIERPVEESLRLREERVTVERNTVDRPATEADFAAFKESEIELTESAEVPVVSKQARVVEEISLDKEVEERQETIHDTVRSTEVDVEDLDKDDMRRGKSGNSGFMNSDDKQNNF